MAESLLMQATMTKAQLRLESLSGEALHRALPALARLRTAVFRDWPYLYDGDAAYEERYLATYAASPGAAVAAAFDGAEPVGMSTCQPMAEAAESVQAAFRGQGLDPARFCYFGESVLLPRYRGHGIGHAFFDHREDAARSAGAEAATFASVIRPADHPARPHDYRPLDQFWHKRGYAPVDGLVTQLAWKEHGEESESLKPMQYWMRAL